MCCFCNIITILWWHNHTSLMHKLQTFGIIKDFLYYPELSRLSGNFPDYPETSQTMWTLARLSGNLLDFQETFHILWRFSKLSENFPYHPENIQIIGNLSEQSGNFSGCPETFQIIRKLPRRKLFRPSGNIPVQFQGLRAKTFRMRKNFPDGNATMPLWFLCLRPARDLVGRKQEPKI